MKRRVVLTVLAFSLVAGAIAYGVLEDAREARLVALVEAVGEAERTLAYEGTREMKGRGTVVLRVWGQGDRRGVEFVRSDGFSKSRRRHGRRHHRGPYFGRFPTFLKPGHGKWRHRIKDAELVVRNYAISHEGRETVAGRPADVYLMEPRNEERAAYRAWVDAENRFLLGFQVRRDDRVVFETRFTEISFPGTLPEDSFRESRRHGRAGWLSVATDPVPAEDLSTRAGFDVWFPAWVPAGFELRDSELVRVKVNVPERMRAFLKGLLPETPPELDVPVAHLNYTDGLAVLSVVQCASDSALWKLSRRFLPGAAKEQADGKVVAHKISDRGGAAYVMDVGETVILVSGNVSSGEIETMIRTFERK